MSQPSRTPQTQTRASHRRAPLLDLAGVAERLGVNERHVRRLVAERRIPYIKWGRLLRFEPDDVEAWIERSRRPAMQPSGLSPLAKHHKATGLWNI